MTWWTNTGPAELKREGSVLLWEYLKKRMLAHPGSTVCDGQEAWSFPALADDAEKRARILPAGKIGLDCARELHTAQGLLACLAAGATAVPLSSRYGAEHCRKIVEGIGLTAFLTDRGPDGSLRLEYRGEPQPEREDLSDVALIMCTSGTTGSPKGAMITDTGLLVNLRDIERYFRIGEGDRLLIVRPLYHCAVLTGEFLISLATGADIVFYDGAFNPLRIGEQIGGRGITVLCGTPTLFCHLCALAGRLSRPLGLRCAAVSGECMTPAVAQAMRKALPAAAIYNVYGLTEASPRVCALPPERFDEKPTSVGRPLASLEVRVADEAGAPVPAGQAGELLVRGPSLMKGYYGQPEQTARVMRDGWLHTGDIAAIDEEGLVAIHARRDNLIIRAGMNIYPQEIENALQQDGLVREVLAYGVQQSGGGQRIAVKAVLSDPAAGKADFLAVCRRRLSPYQMPDMVELTDRLQRNGSGKLIRPKTAWPYGREEGA